MNTHKIAARSFGIAFLIGYLSYGLGFGLLNRLINTPEGLAYIHLSKNQIVLEGAIMMAIFATSNIGLAIIMLPYFKVRNQTFAYGYLGAAITSSILLIIGAVFLLLLMPLSDEFVRSGSTETSYFQSLSVLCKQANFFCYQIAMVIWGLGGLMFCYLLYISSLAPKWLSVYGFISYIIFISGAIFALFGFPIDVLLDIPGGLFELFLSVWFIVKGFDLSKHPHQIS